MRSFTQIAVRPLRVKSNLMVFSSLYKQQILQEEVDLVEGCMIAVDRYMNKLNYQFQRHKARLAVCFSVVLKPMLCYFD